MTAWTPLLNDKIPDCGVAACGHAIQLWTGKAPSDADIQIAQDRFSSLDSTSKPLWGWMRRGIGKHRLGGYARIRREQIPDAVARFGCAYVGLTKFMWLDNHIVLQVKGGVVSGGVEYPGAVIPEDVDAAYAIAEHWHPILLWWTLRNLFL